MSNFLTDEQLEALTTQRLYAYKKSLLKATDGPDWDPDSDNYLHRKNPEWIRAHNKAKEILNTREHLERKKK